MDQTLPNIFVVIRPLFALEKHWRLYAPLLPSMLTIFLSRFQTIMVFFLNNSHLIYTFIFCFCSSYFAFSCIYFVISHSTFIRRRRQTDSRKFMLLFEEFLASEHIYLLKIFLLRKKNTFFLRDTGVILRGQMKIAPSWIGIQFISYAHGTSFPCCRASVQ